MTTRLNTIETDTLLPGVTLIPAEQEFWLGKAHGMLNESSTKTGGWKRTGTAKEVDRLIGIDNRKRLNSTRDQARIWDNMVELPLRLACALYEQRQDLRDQQEIDLIEDLNADDEAFDAQVEASRRAALNAV